MAAAVAFRTSIAGLDRSLHLEDFKWSTAVYNDLIQSDDLKDDRLEDHVRSIGAIIVRHGHEEAVGMHLVHGHSKLSNGTIMMGHRFDKIQGYWYRETPANDVQAQSLVGHIFKLVPGHGWVAYDFVHAGTENLVSITTEFIDQISSYITKHNLHDILGLQLLNGTGNMYEVDCAEAGTIMIPTSQATTASPFRTTGWTFRRGKDGIEIVAAEKHAKTVKGPHKVFWPKELDITERSVEKLLREHGVIA